VKSDVRYYRRRAYEEMAAANRAVTDAARQRRLLLVDTYVQHLEALHQPNPFDDPDYVTGLDPAASGHRPAIDWRDSAGR
jgi:hypothetical protein